MTLQDHSELYEIIQDFTGLYKTIEDNSGLYSTIYSGLYRTIQKYNFSYTDNIVILQVGPQSCWCLQDHFSTSPHGDNGGRVAQVESSA